jgi:hypothetical protein
MCDWQAYFAIWVMTHLRAVAIYIAAAQPLGAAVFLALAAMQVCLRECARVCARVDAEATTVCSA